MFIGIAPANNFIAAVCKIPPDTAAFYIFDGTGSPFFSGIKPMTGIRIGFVTAPCNAVAFHLIMVDVMGSYIKKSERTFLQDPVLSAGWLYSSFASAPNQGGKLSQFKFMCTHFVSSSPCLLVIK